MTRLAYASVLVLASAWVAGIFLTPFVESGGAGVADGSTLGVWLHFAYSRVCHQIGDRSFHIAGHALAVCARCSGIYLGYLTGLIIYPRVRSLTRTDLPRRAWLIAAMAPVTVDAVGGLLGIFENTEASRALTGFIAGAAIVFYTLPGLLCLAASLFTPNQNQWLAANKGEGTPPSEVVGAKA